jgi:colanic acid biosynthesis glycosyl transferase WcaI
MRILIYSMHFWPEPTGIGKYSGEMAFWLSRQGHDVRVICSPPWYPFWAVQKPYRSASFETEQTGGIRITRCPQWVPRRPTGLTRIICLGSFAISSFAVALKSIFWRPDVVFAVEPPFFCLPGAIIAAKLSRACAWLHVQDFEVDAAVELGIFRFPGLNWLLRKVEALLFRCFDRCSTISDRMLDLLKQRCGQPEKCSLFRNWVDLKVIYPMESSLPFRKELGIGSHDIVALYSGNIGEKQGLEIAIEAARMLNQESSITFVFCGNGAAVHRIRSLSEGLPNLRWLPVQPVERLNELLNLADIHLLPQKADAADLVMPSKLTGMLASGRPVVATAAAGTQVSEVVQQCGIVVSPGDTAAFAEAISRLAADPQLRQQQGIAARKIAVNELEADRVLFGFEAMLEAAIRQGGMRTR